MQTARLHEIVRQKDPELKEAVEQLARGDVHGAIANLDQQGRVHEIVGPRRAAQCNRSRVRARAARHAGHFARQRIPTRAERADPSRDAATAAT